VTLLDSGSIRAARAGAPPLPGGRLVVPEGAPPPAYEEFRDAEIARLIDRFLRVRLYFAPAIAAVVLLIGWTAPSTWLRGALLCAATALLVVSWTEARRGPWPASSPRLTWNLLFMVTVQGAIVLLTGGLLSPLVVILLPLALTGAWLMGRTSGLAAFALLQQATIWGAFLGRWLDLLPPGHLAILGRDAATPGALPHSLALGVVISALLLASTRLGLALREMTDGMLYRAFLDRETALAGHTQRLRELSALSGEIAHELKNPLATVKGLSALIGRSLGAGKDHERMTVLRREVDRMEDILSDFLNFSRPLLPLEHASVAAASLLGDVMDLQEGLAAQRGVELVLDCPRGLTVVCDARKVHQVLVNLVQNSLDVAPAGTRIHLQGVETATGLALQVADRGPGLEGDLEGPFLAGHTTKPGGNGLGLTISRALVRQHGGDLTLAPRPGGGLVARVELPRTPAVAS
jgi:two-component system sensor histidine kinase HydH